MNLQGADLRNAVLRWARLRNAYLAGADLFGAGLTSANLTRADLSVTNLEEAEALNGTIMHDVKGLSDAQLQMCVERGAVMTYSSPVAVAKAVSIDGP